MKINKEVTFYRPLLINDKELVYLDSFMKEFFEEVQYKAKCKSDTIIEFKDLTELISFENPSFRKIEKLEITAFKVGKNQYTGDRVYIKFNNKSIFDLQSANCSIEFNSEKEFDSFYVGFIKRMKCLQPWYNFLNTFPASLVILFTLAIPTFVFVLIIGFFDIFNKTNFLSSGDGKKEGFLTYAFILICYLIFSLTIDNTVNFFFPKVFYDIGKQKKVLLARHKFLYIIFGVIGLGVLINIISYFVI